MARIDTLVRSGRRANEIAADRRASMLRAEARARIESRRRAASVIELFARADEPAVRIRVSKDAAGEILSSFPGDAD